jgi:hypothetical protein
MQFTEVVSVVNGILSILDKVISVWRWYSSHKDVLQDSTIRLQGIVISFKSMMFRIVSRFVQEMGVGLDRYIASGLLAMTQAHLPVISINRATKESIRSASIPNIENWGHLFWH